MSEKDQIESMFDNDFDLEPEIQPGEDLGNDIGPVVDFTETAEPKVVEKTNKAVAKVSKATPSVPDLDFDFADLGAMPGVVVGDIGIEVSRFPVEKTRFTKDSRTLLSVVSGRVAAIKTHYREGLGSYLCWGGKCCEVDGLSRVKYLLPVVVYDTDRRGAPISTKLDYKVLSIGKDQYDDILTVVDLNGEVTQFDLLVTCKDEQYQKISFTLAGNARWKKNAKMVKEVKEFWTENMKHILKPVARKISEADLMRELGADEIVPAKEVNFDDVFDN